MQKKLVTLTISFTATNSKNDKETDNKKLDSKINMKQLDHQEYENIKLHPHISFNKQINPNNTLIMVFEFVPISIFPQPIM